MFFVSCAAKRENLNAQTHGCYSIDCLGERGIDTASGHKAKGIKPSIVWRRHRHCKWAQSHGPYAICSVLERDIDTASGHKARGITPSIVWRRHRH